MRFENCNSVLSDYNVLCNDKEKNLLDVEQFPISPKTVTSPVSS